MAALPISLLSQYLPAVPPPPPPLPAQPAPATAKPRTMAQYLRQHAQVLQALTR